MSDALAVCTGCGHELGEHIPVCEKGLNAGRMCGCRRSSSTVTDSYDPTLVSAVLEADKEIVCTPETLVRAIRSGHVPTGLGAPSTANMIYSELKKMSTGHGLCSFCPCTSDADCDGCGCEHCNTPPSALARRNLELVDELNSLDDHWRQRLRDLQAEYKKIDEARERDHQRVVTERDQLREEAHNWKIAALRKEMLAEDRLAENKQLHERVELLETNITQMWHDADVNAENLKPLHEHLGMTWEQYQAWAKPEVKR